MIENVLIAGLATVYFAFVFTAKRGPFDFFSKIRAAAKRIPVLGYHLSCPTCLSLSSGALLFALTFTPLAFVVHIMAVAGIVLALHGMAGYWHSKDDEPYSPV